MERPRTPDRPDYTRAIQAMVMVGTIAAAMGWFFYSTMNGPGGNQQKNKDPDAAEVKKVK